MPADSDAILLLMVLLQVVSNLLELVSNFISFFLGWSGVGFSEGLVMEEALHLINDY